MNTTTSLFVPLMILLLGFSSLALSRQHKADRSAAQPPSLSQTEQQALKLLKEEGINLPERIQGCSRGPGFQTPGEPVYHKVTCRFDGDSNFVFKEVDDQLVDILEAEANL